MLFRFDDVCINADIQHITQMTNHLLGNFDCQVIWAISPLVHSSEKSTQRIFPKTWNALSDYKIHYQLDQCGVIKAPGGVIRASHGLVHADHRLLSKEAQEMSILVSSYLANASIFVPPFNKWNSDTEAVCKENDITLIKFEDGWLSMEHNKFDPTHEKWYLHAREFTMEDFIKWFK